MSTDLERFRDHCRQMVDREHKPECEQRLKAWIERDLARRYLWNDIPDLGPRPECDGCVTTADKALFTSLADEVDAYLTTDDAPLWEDA